MKSIYNKHILYVALMLILTIIVFSSWIPLSDFVWGEHAATYMPRAQILKTSITKYHDFLPLWSPFTMGGTPFFSKADTVTIGHPLYLLILMFPPAIAVKINYFLNIFLAGLFMYLFCLSIRISPEASFVSSIVYMFNGFATKIFGWGWQTTLDAYIFIPLIMLFVIKAFRTKKWITYSVITGVLFALQIFAGPDLKVFLFTGLLVAIYSIVHVISNRPFPRMIKVVLIGVIVLAVLSGLTAVKILPAKEYIDMSSRSQMSWEQASKRSVKPADLFDRLIEPVYEGMPKIRRNGGGDHVGIVAFLLACFALYRRYKNRLVIFLGTTGVFSVLFAMGSFVFFFLWKYVPPFDNFRYADRSLVLFVFSLSVLAGIGAYEVLKLVRKEWYKPVAWGLAIIILINLTVFGYNSSPLGSEKVNIFDAIDEHHALKYMSEDTSHFRMHNYETRGIDWGTELFNIPYGLQAIYGYEGAWLIEYMNVYLAFAYNDPAKFWGLLNVKYVTAKNEINISGLRLIKKFDNCSICFPDALDLQKSWGPYLYENTLFMPRAYIVPHAVLVVGEKNAVTQTIYGLMADNFNPNNTVIIRGKSSINAYSAAELAKFDAVVLTQGSVDSNSAYILQNYVNSGGILLPDLTQNKNSIGPQDIQEMWNSFINEGIFIPDEDIIMHDFDTREIKVQGNQGFLVVSELFSIYPGWKAYSDKTNMEILNANSMNTAVYLHNGIGSVNFLYKPASYVLGKYISLLTLCIIIGYFLYMYRKK